MATEYNLGELIACDQWEVIQSLICTKLFHANSREIATSVSALIQVIPMIHILNIKIEVLFEETVDMDTMLKFLKESVVS